MRAKHLLERNTSDTSERSLQNMYSRLSRNPSLVQTKNFQNSTTFVSLHLTFSIPFPEGPLLDRPQRCVVGPSSQFATYGGAQEEKIRMSAYEMSANIHWPTIMAPHGCSIEWVETGKGNRRYFASASIIFWVLAPSPIFWAPAAACPKPVQHQPIFLLKLKMPSQDEQWMCTS